MNFRGPPARHTRRRFACALGSCAIAIATLSGAPEPLRHYAQLVDAVREVGADGVARIRTVQVEWMPAEIAGGEARIESVTFVEGGELSRKACRIETAGAGFSGELRLAAERGRAAGSWRFSLPPADEGGAGSFEGGQGAEKRAGRATAVAVYDVRNRSGESLRAWVPPGTAPVRGVFIWGNRYIIDDRWEVMRDHWLGLCRLHRLALVALGGYDYQMRFGEGRVLREQLAELARRSGHAELETAPVLFTGHSNGGMKAWEYNAANPERVIAFTVSRAAFDDMSPASEAACANPAMLVCGAHDSPDYNHNIFEAFRRNRSDGAAWSYVVERGVGHEFGLTPDLWLPFFDWALRARLPTAEAPAGARLRPVDASDGWIVVQRGVKPGERGFGRVGTIQAPLADTSWFPNQAMVLAYLGFVAADHPVALEMAPMRRRFVAGETLELRVPALPREMRPVEAQLILNGAAIGKLAPGGKALLLKLDTPGVFVATAVVAADGSAALFSRPVSWVVEPRD